MTHLEKRWLFTSLVAKLIDKINSTPGYACAGNEWFRPVAQAAVNAAKGSGIKNSLHTLGLAIDINLYKDGVWQTTTEAHRQFGEWWKQQHELCRWGGDFKDGNHYSMEHNGVK